ncbi:MAG: winged helix-turn-helix domain-containing protein [Anaerolineales bacterium]
MTTYSLPALRAVALYTQALHTANGRELPTQPESLFRMVDQIGCVQIDTLHMVRRSHYLVPWSRMGNYKPDEFDELIFGSQRQLFEGWEHAASIIPLVEYRFQIPHQRNLREHPTNWYNNWLNDQVKKDFVPQVLERVRNEGALKVSKFESDGHQEGSWWNWRPAKVALEYLFSQGELMIADREKFQRVYDLTDRVLPKWVDTKEPSVEERDLFWVERGAKSLGVCSLRQAGDYTWMKVTKSRPHVETLIKNGILLPIKGKLADGQTAELVIHRDNLSLLEQAADGVIKVERTTFLSPFDNLFWASKRDEMLWDFHRVLEAYIPGPKRVYGYFCLQILHKDRLVGRLDPKLERKTGKLILRALYLEPGVKLSERLVNDIAAAMRDFMSFHEAKELIIEHSEPEAFGKKLMASMSTF